MGGEIKSEDKIINLSEKTKVKDYRDQIIGEKFSNSRNERQSARYLSGNVSDEIINVLMGYRWSISDFGGASLDKNLPIPHCYVVEYKQLHNSSITNLINSVTAGVTSLNNFKREAEKEKEKNKIAEGINSINELFNSLVSSLGQNDEESSGSLVGMVYDKIQSIGDWVYDNTKITNGISGSDFLKPYSLLYWLEKTGKQFVFPMVANPPTQSLINTYQDQNSDISILSANSLFSKISGIAEGIVGTSKDLIDLSSMGTKNGSFQMSAVEKAKFFQYPQQTDEYTIQFPLLNTVDSNDWVKNYRFILLFTLRNMVFRMDNASYYPPLFYDLVIPGVIRQPFCYVSSVQVQPLGMVRQMNPKGNILSFSEKSLSTSLTIPDAWVVTIKFKSLLASSANMVLSSMYDLGVQSEIEGFTGAQMPNNVWDTTQNMG